MKNILDKVKLGLCPMFLPERMQFTEKENDSREDIIERRNDEQ